MTAEPNMRVRGPIEVNTDSIGTERRLTGCASPSVGSLRWMRETNGILRPRDRLGLIGQGVLFLLRGAPAELRRALGLGSARLARFDLARLRVPDSPASREAEKLCAQVPPIVNHSYRSYVWAVILAARDGIKYDDELLYVASLLHDIAFAEPPQYPDARPRCFLAACAEAALKLGASIGWEERRAEAAAEAITLHANLYVGLKDGPEAYLLYAGARLDQTGFRYGDLHPDTVRAVLQRYPRQSWKRACCEMMGKQALAAPGSRVHLYTRYLAGNSFIMRAPFED